MPASFDTFSIYITGMFVQIKEALQPDGLFLGAMYGGDTLFELRCYNRNHSRFDDDRYLLSFQGLHFS